MSDDWHIKLTYAVQAVSFASATLAVLLGFLGSRQGNYAPVAENAAVFAVNAAVFVSQFYIRGRQRRLQCPGTLTNLGNGLYSYTPTQAETTGGRFIFSWPDDPPAPKPDRCPHCGARDWGTLHTTYNEVPVCRACWRRP